MLVGTLGVSNGGVCSIKKTNKQTTRRKKEAREEEKLCKRENWLNERG